MKKYCLDGEIAAFDFHDATGFWSFCGPKSLKAFLADLKPGEKAEIEINSPGGSVVEGMEMANAIKNSNAHLIAHVTGIAASMASVVACACDEIVMEEASFMMIHDPWTEWAGNAAELRKEAALLDQMKAVIMTFYRGKFVGKTDEEISALMSDETWYTGSECLANGLVCTVQKSDIRIAAKIGEHNFAKMPEAAKAFYSQREMPEDIKAAIEAAKTAAADNAAPTADGGASAAAPVPNPSDNAASAPELAQASDWEARYKGASKKITELQNKIADITDTAKAAIDAANAKFEAATESVKNRDEAIAARDATIAERDATIQQFNDQVKNAGYENLDALIGAASGLKADLEKGAKDLAESREQLEHLKSTRDTLTAGVLTPPAAESSYKAKMASAKTAEEREALRALKKAGKIK